MGTYKRDGRIVGALFILVMVTWSLGYSLIEPLTGSPDYLQNVYPNKNKLILGVFFELIEVSAVLGIAVMMFPYFKKQNEPIALGYVGIRIIEAIMLIVGALSSLLLLTLSQVYMEATPQDTSYYQALGATIKALRTQWVSLMIGFLYGVSALLFYFLVYRSKLIPRAISIWGLVAVVLMLIDEVIFQFTGAYTIKISGLAILGLHLGLIEIVMGIWLMVKGFNPTANK